MNIDVTVMCSECRAVLETEDDSRMSSIRILVAPCPTCLGAAKDEAREAGIESGRELGYDEGLAIGHQEGRAEAFLEQKRTA